MPPKLSNSSSAPRLPAALDSHGPWDGVLSQLQNVNDVYSLLMAIAPYASYLGLKTLRYYSWTAFDSSMRSVECFGHSERIRTKMQVGRIWHRGNAADLQPSFHALATLKPVAFRIDNSITAAFEFQQGDPLAERLPCYLVKDDTCAPILADIRAGAPSWIDIPILLHSDPIGKLSCDIDPGDHDPDSPKIYHHSEEMQHLLRVVAPFFHSFSPEQTNPRLLKAIQDITHIETYSELFAYCVDQLRSALGPTRFDYASFYSVSADSLGNELLVLRATTCDESQSQIGIRAFNRGDAGLVPNVWRTNQISYVQDSANERMVELDGEPANAWRPNCRTLQLANLLVIPVRDLVRNPSNVVGVLLLGNTSECQSSDAAAALAYQTIADACLGAKMNSIASQEFAQKVLSHIDGLNLELIEDPVNDPPDLTVAFADKLNGFFSLHGRDSEKSKLIEICLVDRRHDSCKTYVIGGSLPTNVANHQEHRLAGTLTGYAMSKLQEHCNTGRWIYINDLKAAEARGYYRFDEDAVCGIASLIWHRSEVFGVLLVFSAKHDIPGEQYGQLVAFLGRQLGQIIARRQAIEFSAYITGLRHDCLDMVRSAYQKIGAERKNGALTDQAAEESMRILEFLLSAIDVHARRGPMDGFSFAETACADASIYESIRRAADYAIHALGEDDVVNMIGDISIAIDRSLRVRIQENFLVVASFNLLKNALNYRDTKKPSILVNATIDADVLTVVFENSIPEGNADELTRRISDTIGEGLPDAIFGLWHETARKGGSGIRLVRRIADLHRIKHSRESEERSGELAYSVDRGARTVRFMLKLPIAHCAVP